MQAKKDYLAKYDKKAQAHTHERYRKRTTCTHFLLCTLREFTFEEIMTTTYFCQHIEARLFEQII